jgi:hypothetical protein
MTVFNWDGEAKASQNTLTPLIEIHSFLFFVLLKYLMIVVLLLRKGSRLVCVCSKLLIITLLTYLLPYLLVESFRGSLLMIV